MVGKFVILLFKRSEESGMDIAVFTATHIAAAAASVAARASTAITFNQTESLGLLAR